MIANSKLTDSINYAIRNNDMEGLVTSNETVVMLERITAGELTFSDMRKAIDHKARSLAQGKKITLIEAWGAIKEADFLES